MNSSSLRRALVASLSFLALTAGGSANAAFRAYVSASGVDTNPCTLAAPCRLLPAALAAVDFGGEIWMLDSANYNSSTVSITKSVTILAIPGQVGSVVGLAGTAFAINAPGIDVTLQNLNILSFSGTGDVGVLVSNAAQVSIINCNIFGFRGLNAGSNNGVGIWVNPFANAPKVNVVNSVVRNNSSGIVVAGNGRATISKTHVLGNGLGIVSRALTGFSVVNVSDSVSSGNSYGFVADGCSGGGACTSQMFVTRSIATENMVDGFTTQGGTNTLMSVGDSMSTHNGDVGFRNSVGIFQSLGNNNVSGNFNSQTSGPISPQAGL